MRNDWSKVIQIQENAIGMPESPQGTAHYCDIGQDNIFHTNPDCCPAHGEGGKPATGIFTLPTRTRTRSTRN